MGKQIKTSREPRLQNGRHGSYVTKNFQAKSEGFNDHVVRNVLRMMAKNPKCSFKFSVMDDKGAYTTKALIHAGITTGITAFSYDAEAVAGMPKKIKGVYYSRRVVEAGRLYSRISRRRAHIIIDDGMGYGRTTIGRIEILLRRGCPLVGLMCNIVPRCEQKSHRTFQKTVTEYARKQGYHVKSEAVPSYTQNESKCGGWMWPFWFEFQKIETIDLTNE